jgi:hypothetical protein
MKKVFVLFFCLIFFWQVQAQQKSLHKAGAVIKFNQTSYQFGKIFFRSPGKHSFKFVNAGSEPLLLSQPRSSCGCTIPSWPKAPILPGDSGSIEVTYNTHIVGSFNKTVTVYSNAQPVVLHIRGEVVPRPKPLLPVKTTTPSGTPIRK